MVSCGVVWCRGVASRVALRVAPHLGVGASCRVLCCVMYVRMLCYAMLVCTYVRTYVRTYVYTYIYIYILSGVRVSKLMSPFSEGAMMIGNIISIWTESKYWSYSKIRLASRHTNLRMSVNEPYAPASPPTGAPQKNQQPS